MADMQTLREFCERHNLRAPSENMNGIELFQSLAAIAAVCAEIATAMEQKRS